MSAQYLEGSQFTIPTEHGAFRGILDMTDAIGKLESWHPRLSESYFEVVHLVGIKQQTADDISRLRTTGVDESPVEDDVLVFIITEAQPEREKIQTDAKIWHGLPCNDQMEPASHALPEVLPVLDETDKERLPATSEFVTERAIYHNCKEVANTLG